MRSGRVRAILAALLGGIVLVVASGMTWRTGELGDATIELAGTVLAPAATALGIAGLATALGMLLAQARLARVLGVVALLVGLAAGWSVVAGGLDATDALRVAVQERTGLSGGAQPLPELTSTFADVAAVAGAVLVALGGAEALRTARSWRRSREAPSRYERVESGLAWDALDAGTDPTTEREGEAPSDR